MSQPSEPNELFKRLTDNLERVRQETAEADKRHITALAEASNLAERNKTLRRELEDREKTELAKIESIERLKRKELEAQLQTLEKTKKAVLDDIEGLNRRRTKAAAAVEDVDIQKAILASQLDSSRQLLKSLEADLQNTQKKIEERSQKLLGLGEQVNQLIDSRHNIEADIQVMQAEAERMENKIIELDTTFKARKESLDSQLRDIQVKLENASQRLVEAQNKDKAIRKAWAEEHLKLDKRTQAAQAMEARLRGAEDRAAELERFTRL